MFESGGHQWRHSDQQPEYGSHPQRDHKLLPPQRSIWRRPIRTCGHLQEPYRDSGHWLVKNKVNCGCVCIVININHIFYNYISYEYLEYSRWQNIKRMLILHYCRFKLFNGGIVFLKMNFKMFFFFFLFSVWFIGHGDVWTYWPVNTKIVSLASCFVPRPKCGICPFGG